MRRNNENAAEESLELLLDTICNAFGGILFLTILLALLLKISSAQILPTTLTEPARHELIEQESKLSEAIATYESLQKTANLQQGLRRQFLSPEISTQFTRLQDFREKRDSLKIAWYELTQQNAKLQQEIDQLIVKQQELEKRRANREQELGKVLQSFHEHVRKQERITRPSRTRSTYKKEFGVVIRYDRVYLIFQENPREFTKNLNSEDFVAIEDENGIMYATPKPLHGLPISDAPNFRQQLKELLRYKNSRDHYIAIAIWEDSFDSFHLLREALFELGYEYRTIPFSKEGVLHFGPIENPQVQ